MEHFLIMSFLGINSWIDIRRKQISLLSIGFFMVVGIVAIGYIGSLLGLGTGVYCARELKHAGIINR